MKKVIFILVLSALAIGCSSLSLFGGNLEPSGNPAPSMKTLDDIYNKITTGSNAGSHSLFPSGSPASTMHTLQEIYNAIPTGLTTANSSDVLNGKTTIIRSNGSMLIITGTATMNSNANALQGWAWGENIGWIYFDSIIISFSRHNLRIIPNYVKSGESDTAKIFLDDADIKPGTQFKITILTISGRRIVRDLPQTSYEKLNIGLTWDLKDNDGEALPSGVYTVFVTGGGKKYKKAFYFRK